MTNRPGPNVLMNRARTNKPAAPPSPAQLEAELRRLRRGIARERAQWTHEQARLLAAEQALEGSRKRYADLYDFAPVGHLTLERDGRICEFNLTFAKLLGFDRHYLLGHPLLPLVAEPDRRRFLNYLAQVRRATAPLTAELHFRRRDKSELLLRLVAQPHPAWATGRGRILCGITDVTAQRETEIQLLAAQAQLALITDITPTMLARCSREWRFLFVNRAYAELLGHEPGHVAGKPIAEILSAEACETLRPHIERVLRGERVEYEAEIPYPRAGRRYLRVVYVPDKDRLGHVQGWVASLTDLTERKQMEQALRQARDQLERRVRERTAELTRSNAALRTEIRAHRRTEEARDRLAAIVETSSDAIVSAKLDLTITSWNRAAEQIYGYSRGEILGRPLSLLHPPERRREFQRVLADVRRGTAVEAFETVRLHKDGTRLELSITNSPIRDAKGRVIGFSHIARDISLRKRLEEELVRLSEQERQRLAEDLHDGLGQQLAGVACLSNALKKSLAGQASPGAAAAGRISNMLDVAVAQTRNLAHGLYPVVPEPAGLMSALENLAANTADLFKVSCQFECRQPVLIADNDAATHLYRIAQEAVTNAVKHGRAGRIKIALSSNPERIVLGVSNNGVGFSRNGPARDGLGLRIMDYRAERIGGALVFRKRRRGQTEVVCTVPAASALIEPNEEPVQAERL